MRLADGDSQLPKAHRMVSLSSVPASHKMGGSTGRDRRRKVYPVPVYDRALSPEEIPQNYSAGLALCLLFRADNGLDFAFGLSVSEVPAILGAPWRRSGTCHPKSLPN